MSDNEVILKITTNNRGLVLIEDDDGNVLQNLNGPAEDYNSKIAFLSGLQVAITRAWQQIDDPIYMPNIHRECRHSSLIQE